MAIEISRAGNVDRRSNGRVGSFGPSLPDVQTRFAGLAWAARLVCGQLALRGCSRIFGWASGKLPTVSIEGRPARFCGRLVWDLGLLSTRVFISPVPVQELSNFILTVTGRK
jgi:hypothetical protein